MANKVVIVGGGLAGSEAAWQLAKRGYRVELYEMRPGKSTPAHKTGLLAELVCSNSFRSLSVENAVGLLKAELAMLDSLIMEAAYSSQLPAGGALAVDREQFASFITDRLAQHPLINIYRQEITTIPDHRPLIIATGPLTSDALACKIVQITGQDQLYFYDAAAPIVDASTINEERVFRASRYGKGGGDYINCPLTEEEYTLFWQELLKAEQYPLHSFEEEVLFEGCMPVESLAKRGFDTLRFGPLKPVGLVDPYTGKQPFAVVQLRQDNKEGTLYNMGGFQTKLKWPEQKRVFRLIPGLENA
ncbi:MAG: methylenetetrahydrofolate--tRNA-(uracil(54)-C(5))-methyltransferase (FADH(2)-oxidizing) TrmFO, partial [Firmicutes bacterium]|nr:methylenetetrahydrofolate--tRNA-(uracil(54)-C(5))-methyltransferase (FADH(2)-oxidizing) TrmFO [Bacillota bacterium]